MRLLSFSHKYGMVQLDRKVELGLLAVCWIIVAGCILATVAFANDSSRDYYSSRDWNSNAATTAAQAHDNFNRQYDYAILHGLQSFWSGFFSFSCCMRSGINANTAYVDPSADGTINTARTWSPAIATFRNGSRVSGVVNSRGDFFSNVGDNGLLGGPI